MMLGYFLNRLIKKARGKAIRNSTIGYKAKIESGSQVINSTFGRYSFCGYDCKIINTRIGSFCSIADRVSIGLAKHPTTWASMSPVFYEGRDSINKKFSRIKRESDGETVIGDDVWIGENAMIKAGVSIGTGAVIGMGSVVTHDVRPYEIVAGIPAKHIKNRFDDFTISMLLKSKWWEWDETTIKKQANKIKKPAEFCEL